MLRRLERRVSVLVRMSKNASDSAVTMQSDRSRLLDLFPRELRRSALADHRRICSRVHSSSRAKICCAIAFLPTALLRLDCFKKRGHDRSLVDGVAPGVKKFERLPGNGCESESFRPWVANTLEDGCVSVAAEPFGDLVRFPGR